MMRMPSMATSSDSSIPKKIGTLDAVVTRIIPQEESFGIARIPVLPAIDCRRQVGSDAGHEENTYSDRQAYRLAARAFAETAQIAYGRPFERLLPGEQDELLKSVYEGDPVAAKDLWALTNIKEVWEMIAADCACIYQAHLILQHEGRASSAG